jgi:hypothetical protein
MYYHLLKLLNLFFKYVKICFFFISLSLDFFNKIIILFTLVFTYCMRVGVLT